jgi:hypothetical protein
MILDKHLAELLDLLGLPVFRGELLHRNLALIGVVQLAENLSCGRRICRKRRASEQEQLR